MTLKKKINPHYLVLKAKQIAIAIARIKVMIIIEIMMMIWGFYNI